MKKNFLILTAAIFMAFFTAANAQTFAYRLVKTVSQYGETRDISNSQKIYVHFDNDYRTFYLAKYDGSRAGFPSEASGYACGFANQDIPSGNASGIFTSVRDPLDFQFDRDQDGVHIYHVTRPILGRDIPRGGVIYVAGYATDYAKFNGDFSRINVIINPDKGQYGIYPFIGFTFDKNVSTYVYQRVEAPNANPGTFY
ncbi:MAG: hypothetical protein IJP70_11305 [Bacteroidales bacterium]|nr:hypothetical protein [Bacteroidales bacterium]